MIIQNAHDKVIFGLCKFTENQILSCAGDENIKLWDINQERILKSGNKNSTLNEVQQITADNKLNY